MENRKVLFVHDGPMYYNPQNNTYFGVHYDDKLVNRYIFFGQKVTFLMRLKTILHEETKKYNLIKSPQFSFVEIPNYKSIKSYIVNLGPARKIIEAAVKENDIIIVRLPSSAGVIALKKAREINKPVLVEFVACVFDALWNYDWRGKLMAHYKLYKYKKLMKHNAHTIYVTKMFLQSRYPSSGKSIGCSDVEIPALNENILEKRLKKIKGSKVPYVLGTVAALDVPYKGQKDVIRAIGLLKKQGIFIKYKLVGQGETGDLEKAIINSDVNDLVEIIGPLPHDEIFNFLESIDLYIQPSKQEGLPRALVEAMSKACPALGARTAGIPELIPEECIFKPGDIDQICNKLKKIDHFWLQNQATLNFNVSKDYEAEKLENRRRGFYYQFLKDLKL